MYRVLQWRNQASGTHLCDKIGRFDRPRVLVGQCRANATITTEFFVKAQKYSIMLAFC